MRKSNLLFSAVMALAMGSLASCADDLTNDIQVQETVDHDQVRYLNVSIVSPKGAGTRATADGDFLQGTEEENFVEKMTFVFYDSKGIPTGQAHELTFEQDANKGNKPGDGFTNSTGNVGKIWTSTVPVQLAQGENLPAYVMCFINPVSTVDFKTTPLFGTAENDQTIENITRQAVVTADGYFPMTNSVYYGNSAAGTNVRVFATPINADQLYTSAEKITDAGANVKTVDIYVERYAARVQLNLAPGTTENPTIKPNTDAVNGYTLTFVPEFWRPNAIDQNMYAIKRFGLVGTDGTANYDPTYSTLLTNFDNRTWWNEPDKFRSYWGCSPSYYTNEYPKVSDDITDVAANNDYTGNNYPYDVHYFNYTQAESGQIGTVSYRPSIQWNETNGFNQAYYAREATTASSAWGYKETNTEKGYNPLATLPSAVIIGHYTLTKTNAALTDVPAGQPTFYLYGKTNDKYNLYFDSNIKAAMLVNQNVILQATTANGVTTYAPYRDEAGFDVVHPSKAVRAVKNTTVAGRLVALQLKGTPNNLYYYDATQPDGQEYVLITADNIDIANSNLLSAGYATKYGEGIAYFNIPIEHLGIYDDATGNYITGAKVDGKYDFTKCPAGSFGIVRNHAYTINVTSISGLGTALRDKVQPIVPPVDETTYHISARLNILNWRIVPTQNVVL